MIGEDGVFTDEFREQLPGLLGDNYFNDPETKQQPTKMFDNIKDIKGLVNMTATAQRELSRGDARFADKMKEMIKIPGEGATPEEIAAYNKAVGVPETMDGYELPIPEGDDKAGYEVIANAVKAAAFESGVPASKVIGVWGKVVEAIDQQNKALEQKGLALMAAEETAQKEKYKDKYPIFIEEGDKVLTKAKNGAELGKILEIFGLKNHPAVREFLFEIAPLVNQGSTTLGGSAQEKDEKWFTDYSGVGKNEPVNVEAES